MTETSVKRAIDATGDNIKVLSDTDGTVVQAVGIVDGSGDQTGIGSNPMVTIANLKYYDLETLGYAELKGMEGVAGVIDYKTLIGMGKITNHTPFAGYGERVSLTNITAGNDIWEGTATTVPMPNQTTGEQMTIVSTSAADAAAGTGIRTLDIHGLDITGNPQQEVVTLTGVTPVNTVRTNWRFIQSIHAETVGTGGVAAGTISIYKAGSATTVYNILSPGGNMSLSSLRMVPLGRTFYMTGLSLSAADNTSVRLRLRATSTFEDTLTSGLFFLFKGSWVIQNAAPSIIFDIPKKFPALSIIKLTAYSASNGGSASVNYSGWYE